MPTMIPQAMPARIDGFSAGRGELAPGAVKDDLLGGVEGGCRCGYRGEGTDLSRVCCERIGLLRTEPAGGALCELFLLAALVCPCGQSGRWSAPSQGWTP